MFKIIWACPRFSDRGQAVRFITTGSLMVALVVMLATILHAWQRGTGLRLFFLLLTLTMVSKAWMVIGSSRFDLHQKN